MGIINKIKEKLKKSNKKGNKQVTESSNFIGSLLMDLLEQ